MPDVPPDLPDHWPYTCAPSLTVGLRRALCGIGAVGVFNALAVTFYLHR